MKTQTTEQPEHFPLEIEEKIKKYGRIRNGLIGIAVAGTITALAPIYLALNYKPSGIGETYQNALTTIQELQSERKSLRDKLEKFSYQTPEIKELEKMFNSRYDEILVGINEAIESVEKDIPNMETNLEVIQYQENERARKNVSGKFLVGGWFTMILGGLGGLFFQRKKQDLEYKLKK